MGSHKLVLFRGVFSLISEVACGQSMLLSFSYYFRLPRFYMLVTLKSACRNGGARVQINLTLTLISRRFGGRCFFKNILFVCLFVFLLYWDSVPLSVSLILKAFN